MVQIPQGGAIDVPTPTVLTEPSQYRAGLAQEGGIEEGEQLEHAGTDVVQTGGHIADVQEQILTAAGVQNFEKLRAAADARARASTDPKTIVPQMQADLQAAQDQVIGTLHSAAGRLQLQKSLEWSVKSSIAQAQARAQGLATQQFTSYADAYLHAPGGALDQVVNATDPHVRATVIAATNDMLNGGVTAGLIPAEKAEEWSRALPAKVANMMVTKQLDTDPAGLAQLAHNNGIGPDGKKADGFGALNDADWAKVGYEADQRVYELKRQAYEDQAMAEHQQDKAASVARVGVAKQLSTAQAIVESGQSATSALAGLSDARIDAMFPRNPDQATAMKSEVEDLRAISTSLAGIQGATPQQVATLRASLPKPDPSQPATFELRQRVLSSFDAARNKTDAQVKADSASYVLKADPSLAPMMDAAFKDPAKNFAPYATAVLGAQAHIGVAPEDQHVLPQPVAASMAKDIMSDPETAPAKIAQMKTEYGDNWTQVAHDIATVGGLPPAFEAIGQITDAQQGATLAKGLGERGKSGKYVAELLPKDMRTGPLGIDLQIEGNKDIQNFTLSLARSGGSPEYVASLNSAVKTLAYSNVVYNGMPAAAAVKAAVHAFTGNYDFSLPGGPRVPLANAPTVAANARFITNSLAPQAITTPPGVGGVGQPSADAYVAALKGGATWVTVGNGVRMMGPDGRFVKTAKGGFIDIPFAAQLATGAVGKAETDFTTQQSTELGQ